MCVQDDSILDMNYVTVDIHNWVPAFIIDYFLIDCCMVKYHVR